MAAVGGQLEPVDSVLGVALTTNRGCGVLSVWISDAKDMTAQYNAGKCMAKALALPSHIELSFRGFASKETVQVAGEGEVEKLYSAAAPSWTAHASGGHGVTAVPRRGRGGRHGTHGRGGGSGSGRGGYSGNRQSSEVRSWRRAPEDSQQHQEYDDDSRQSYRGEGRASSWRSGNDSTSRPSRRFGFERERGSNSGGPGGVGSSGGGGGDSGSTPRQSSWMSRHARGPTPGSSVATSGGPPALMPRGLSGPRESS